MKRTAPRRTAFLARLLCAILLTAGANLPAQVEKAKARPALDQALKELKVPPDWWDGIDVKYDLNQPWKDGRLEIRRRLALGDQTSFREAMKLTVLYAEKNDIGNGHELPMYLFLGGEVAWAVVEYRKFLAPTIADPQQRGETNGFICLAACYQHFGEYDKAIDICNVALKHLPIPPWAEMNAAGAYGKLGDLYAELGQTETARQHYQTAIANYKVAKPQYGRHLLPRRIARIQSRLDLMALESLRSGSLRDGVYRAQALGYGEPLTVTVTVKSGRIADVGVKHTEKIDLGATKIIPKQIVERQSLKVDTVTGATITCQAIVEGALNALKNAGPPGASQRTGAGR